MSGSTELVIGVDGGGTKTVAWIAPLEDSANTVVLGRGQAGPGNPRAAGFEVAQANIALAVQYAFDEAKLPRATASAACFGLAGAGRPGEQERIAKWAKEFGIASKVKVVGDAEPILAAGAADNTGIALICGTGSLAWGRNERGEVARCGGWGYLLGDEGSAYAVARAGFQAAMRGVDGRGPETRLLEGFQKQLGVESVEELIDQIYSQGMPRERFAGLARVVFDAAEADEVAQGVIAEAARVLAEMVSVLSRQLGLKASYTLAVAGSVLINEQRLRDAVIAELRDAPPGRVICVPDPVRGAVAMARQALRTE